MNIKNYSIKELETLSQEIRNRILEIVSKNGGHLSSTMGATDLIVAMHRVFDAKKDPFIFDVSHQAYAHKLLTDRWESFKTLRQFGGICGYTKPKESPYDYYVAGHSSTSISLAVGAAKAIALKGECRTPIAFIGDGSMSAGMVYEALNELGDRKYPVVIILNDNEMSIAKPIGAISKLLSQTMASSFYQKFKGRVEKILEHLPESATYMAKRFEESLKLITPGILFEEMGIEYIGPVDGHDIGALIETMKVAKNFGKPVIIHAQTTKGKGYEIAEGTKEHWHGVGAFDLETGKAYKKSSTKTATQIFSETLAMMADGDDKIVGVTAAMPSGTGIDMAMKKYPERFWDVGIAEQHAVTSMGPLAKEGFKPFCAIYSTFLQRGYDQVIHDICLMDLGITFALDRAGIVGEDGETHQGVFDISYLRPIPNITLLAPYNESSMKKVMAFAKDYESPCVFRYPRGAFLAKDCEVPDYELGKAHLLQEGESDILLVGYGNGVGRAEQTAVLLAQKPAILDLRFVKPLDKIMLKILSKKYRRWYLFSDSARQGGVGSAILELFVELGIDNVALISFEYDDNFITHGNTKLVEESLGILPIQIAQRINEE
ncbi:MAG: 1-deoxy-D-xylulose-5-phosphate synthase [Sulfurovum sp.]|nr:1-deoxy-D-xylulose-5-phosphate synthase [Sulfurovum sp.]MCB4744428.1 1-deoxy-D-xylulose-5-phosphate synthase [Sulfurovum sp.]MCB4745888.1 1-deoxy-D-xylulose-5-phosphate synthase [Sulfurovum sp.]MCB4747582.1 1-deoxy-D-xylulose-5-phosphate synthase [Sulfurovum sp.]MCB4748955.1 1-deoxy-D-xylulose-5-phosphate synthase [Sulfurovum sp.]